MIVGLLLGRKGSKGFPGKNTHTVMGKPLAWYPMTTAKAVREIDRVFLSTDDPALIILGESLDIEIINRPSYLAGDQALGEDAYVHGYNEISRREDRDIEFLVLLFCNSATVSVQSIEQGIRLLREDPSFDSAVTVSRYNMWSPLRARKLAEDGSLRPFVPFDLFGDPKTLNCDRDSQGDVWFADMGCSVVRPRCLERLEDGLLPQKWMGKKIAPIFQEGGCDIDYQWQVPGVSWWIENHWDVKTGD